MEGRADPGARRRPGGADARNASRWITRTGATCPGLSGKPAPGRPGVPRRPIGSAHRQAVVSGISSAGGGHAACAENPHDRARRHGAARPRRAAGRRDGGPGRPSSRGRDPGKQSRPKIAPRRKREAGEITAASRARASALPPSARARPAPPVTPACRASPAAPPAAAPNSPRPRGSQPRPACSPGTVSPGAYVLPQPHRRPAPRRADAAAARRQDRPGEL